MNSPNQIIENINDFNDKLPYSFWEYLKANELIDRRSPISL